MDGRSVQYALGMGRKGAGGQITPVFFEKEMTDELLAFIRTSNPAGEGGALENIKREGNGE